MAPTKISKHALLRQCSYSQVYIPKRCILIQALPPANVYTKLFATCLCIFTYPFVGHSCILTYIYRAFVRVKICNSHFYGTTARARKLKFSGKMALGMMIHQNSERLETVAMETWKSWFVDFEAQFGPERLRFWYQIHFLSKCGESTNYWVDRKLSKSV